MHLSEGGPWESRPEWWKATFAKEVKVVLDKLRWLKTWLSADGNRLDKFERDFVWVSSGTTSFTLSAPQQKQFALLGLQHKGRCLHIRDARES